MVSTDQPRDGRLRSGIAVLALVLCTLLLAGCPDGSGPDAVSIEWASTCLPTGEYGTIVVEYEYNPDTPEHGFYHAGFRATGSGTVAITLQTDVYEVESMEEFAVVNGESYHLIIGFSGFSYDPADPANIGRDDEFVLSSPAANTSQTHGLSFNEITSLYDFEIETCP